MHCTLAVIDKKN